MIKTVHRPPSPPSCGNGSRRLLPSAASMRQSPACWPTRTAEWATLRISQRRPATGARVPFGAPRRGIESVVRTGVSPTGTSGMIIVAVTATASAASVPAASRRSGVLRGRPQADCPATLLSRHRSVFTQRLKPRRDRSASDKASVPDIQPLACALRQDGVGCVAPRGHLVGGCGEEAVDRLQHRIGGVGFRARYLAASPGQRNRRVCGRQEPISFPGTVVNGSNMDSEPF